MIRVFIIGGLLCLLNYWRIEIGSNQEIYMALAKWWSDPAWIPGSFYLSDAPGTRIGFVALIAPLWKFGTFETICMAVSFVNYFILGGVWFLLLTEVRNKIDTLYVILIHLTLFSGLAFLSFYGGEWMFGPAEPKTFAYPFGLLGLYLFLKDKKTLAPILIGISAYFHVLVAGWILCIILMETIYKEGYKKVFKPFGLFLFTISPLFFYLVNEYFKAGLSSFNGADEIFVDNFNNHLRPWLVEKKESRFYLGLLYSIISVFLAFYRHKKADPKIKIIYRFSIYCFVVPTVAIFFAPWNWFIPFLKLFPYRLGLLQKCFLLIGLVTELTSYIEKKNDIYRYVKIFAVVVFIASAGLRLQKNVLNRLGTETDSELQTISNYLKNSYEPGTKLVYLEADVVNADDVFDSLTRKSRMDVYFVNKFFPFSPGKIIEWDRRLHILESIQKDATKLPNLTKENQRLLLTRMKVSDSSFRQVQKFKKFALYEI